MTPTVGPGDIGENVVTAGVDLLDLPVRARLHLGATAVVELTGLRNPCSQLDAFQSGLMAAMLDRAPDGALVRKAGVMSVVVEGGVVRPGDAARGAHRVDEPDDVREDAERVRPVLLLAVVDARPLPEVRQGAVVAPFPRADGSMIAPPWRATSPCCALLRSVLRLP
jgi:hypothetical protein